MGPGATDGNPRILYSARVEARHRRSDTELPGGGPRARRQRQYRDGPYSQLRIELPCCRRGARAAATLEEAGPGTVSVAVRLEALRGSHLESWVMLYTSHVASTAANRGPFEKSIENYAYSGNERFTVEID